MKFKEWYQTHQVAIVGFVVLVVEHVLDVRPILG